MPSHWPPPPPPPSISETCFAPGGCLDNQLIPGLADALCSPFERPVLGYEIELQQQWEGGEPQVSGTSLCLAGCGANPFGGPRGSP